MAATYKRNYVLKCWTCGSEFQAFHKNGRYCSKSCSWKSAVRRETQASRKAKLSKMQDWGIKNKERRREYSLRYTYGLSLEQYQQLLEKQEFQCYVCRRHENEFNKKLCVDHDHKTREIFGLLCFFCNKFVIGRIRDPELFRRAALYLEKGSGFFVPEKVKKRKKRPHTSGRAKLTEEQAMEILRSTLSLRKLARKYQVTSDAIKSVKTGQTWVHLPRKSP